MDHSNILGVVLAGGKSQRFGEDKCQVKLGDKLLIDYIISEIVDEFKSFGIRTSIFLDPDIKFVESVCEINPDRVELYTEDFAREFSLNNFKAIHNYSECAKEKDKLYLEKILPAFDKLSQNLIFIYGFISPGEPYEHLKNDCVSFLFETIHKWNPDKGPKAFSYFNVVAKNWLIIQSKKRVKKDKRFVSIDQVEEITGSPASIHESFRVGPNQEKNILLSESRKDLDEILKTIRGQLKSEREMICMDAIISLFERADELELLNKRAVFVYLRDISNLSPKQLSVTMSKIRKQYREITGSGDFLLFFGD